MRVIKKEIDLFEFNSNLGLRKQRNQDPQVKFFPEHLKKHGFYEIVNPRKIVSLNPPVYEMRFDKVSGILNVEKVIDYAKKEAKLLEKELRTNHFKLIIGGDCSILLGTALALKKHGNYGLFYLDGHTDYCDVALTDTRAIAGMDLALATGFGPNKLVNIDNFSPYFKEENVYCVGDKESDPDYVKLMNNSQITYFDLEGVKTIGPEAIATSFLESITIKKLDGFFIHFDVDVLAGQLMPAVDSFSEKGLMYDELLIILKKLLSSKKAVGMEMTIFDPSLDESGHIVKKFIEELSSLF